VKFKSLALLASCVLVIGSAALGSIAYLTSSDTNVNTFTVGKVGMELTETRVTPEGVPVEGADRVKENSYRLIPGVTYTKDPTVTIKKGSEESYVRLLVTVNKMAELRAIFGNDFQLKDIVSTLDNNTWEYITVKDNGDNSSTYEFRYRDRDGSKTVGTLTAETDLDLKPLFTHLVYPATITSEQNATLQGLKITVVGQAIQAMGFEETTENDVTKTAEDNAWAAFSVQHPAAGEEGGDKDDDDDDTTETNPPTTPGTGEGGDESGDGDKEDENDTSDSVPEPTPNGDMWVWSGLHGDLMKPIVINNQNFDNGYYAVRIDASDINVMGGSVFKVAEDYNDVEDNRAIYLTNSTFHVNEGSIIVNNPNVFENITVVLMNVKINPTAEDDFVTDPDDYSKYFQNCTVSVY